MPSFDDLPLKELLALSNNLSQDTIGDTMIRAIELRKIVLESHNKTLADNSLDKIRAYARNADIGWKIFNSSVPLEKQLTETQVWQLIAIVGTLREFNYVFERVEEASLFTFENSAPVRFYINGIFHYISTLFLLDFKQNKSKGFSKAGTLIKALDPMGLQRLLDPIYEVFDRPFGEEMNYGQTILGIRNKGFVHGSFSAENIQNIVKDSHIFNEKQRINFIQNHWDLFDKVIILRLQLTSIITSEGISLEDFSPTRLYHL